jgi:hypothetical protein
MWLKNREKIKKMRKQASLLAVTLQSTPVSGEEETGNER